MTQLQKMFLEATNVFCIVLESENMHIKSQDKWTRFGTISHSGHVSC